MYQGVKECPGRHLGWHPCSIHGKIATPLYFKKLSLVSIGAYACGLIVDSTIHIGAVVESPIPPFHWPPSPLVHKVPMEAREGSVLVAFVLKERLALLHPKLLQIPGSDNDRDHFTLLAPSHFRFYELWPVWLC